MATTTVPGQTTMTTSDDVVVYSDEVPGSGWLFLAGTVMGLAGLMRIVDAIWAFRYNGALPDRFQDAVLGSNLTTYAWLWLIVGVVLIASSFLILIHSQFARWFGYFAAAFGALSALTWMPYYPIWSMTYIGIAVFTFYALARYGGREPTIR